MHTLAQDLRYALRALFNNPGYTAVAVLTLALGLGASTGIFSVVNAVLLRPLPFTDPERLIYLRESKLPQLPEFSLSPGNFLDWQDQNGTFDAMAAYGDATFNLTGGGDPERLAGQRVTANLFGLIGVRPILGREFRPEEDAPGGPPVALLAYGLWQGRFGGDPAVVGRAITLNGRPYTVIGVMPAAMQVLRASTQIWVPMAFSAEERQTHGAHYLRAIGRLKAGVDIAQARADLATVAGRLAAQYPVENKGWAALAMPLQDYYVRDVRPALLILLGAVSLVLLVACANVANLLLARGASRQKELAIRAALGAGRGRLVRQLLTEGAVVALAGGAAGLVLADWLLRALLVMAPAALPRAAELGVDVRTVAFAFALSMLTPLAFGLLPSFQVSRTELGGMLNAGGRSGQPGVRRRTRHALVVTEVALATMLVIGSALLARSFLHLQQVDPGFVASDAVLAGLTLPSHKYPERRNVFDFYQRLLERVSQLPGVRAAGVTQSLPLDSDFVLAVAIAGRPPVALTDRPSTNYYSVSPDYFAAMGIRLVRGRLFTEQDGPNAPRVGIVNETFAKRLFPNEDPIGQRVDVSQGGNAWREVVGVVGDTKQYGLARESTNQLYEPYGQLTFPGVTLVVRTANDPASMTSALRGAVREIDPDLPVNHVRTLDDLLAQSLGPERFSAVLLGAFAISSLLLAVIGLYGVLAYSVSQRTLEIGVRMAHGATRSDVIRMFVREGVGLALAGAAIGLAGALALTRVMAGLLFGVQPTDPATLTLAPLALVAVATLACLVPAYRGTRIDPVAALRGE